MAKVLLRTGKILIGTLVVFIFLLVLFGFWSKAISQDTESSDPNTSDLDSVEIIGDSHYRALLSQHKQEIIPRRGPNRRVWEIRHRYGVVDVQAGTAEVEEEVSTIIEMGSGICYLDDTNNWQVTEAKWHQTDNGFIMDQAGYQLAIGPTLDSWLEYTVDGITLSLRPAFILAEDNLNQEILSVRQEDVAGYIDPNNPSRLVFEDAFGEGIDLELCVYPDQYHQNVVFHTLPQASGILKNEKINYEIHTELDMENYVNDGMIEIVFGKDTRFTPDQIPTMETNKEDIRFMQGFVENDQEYEYSLHRFSDSKVFDQSLKHRAVASKRLYQDDSGHVYLAESLGHDFFEQAEYPVTWDYQTVNGYWDPNDNVWYADTTYFISSDLTVDEGELWIEPGTFVKFDSNAKLKTNGAGKIIARGKPYKKIVFCGAGNPYNGETISGQTNWNWDGLEVGNASELEHCYLFHADLGIKFTGVPAIPFRNSHIAACDTGILIEEDAVDPNSTFKIFNNIINAAHGSAIEINGGGGKILEPFIMIHLITIPITLQIHRTRTVRFSISITMGIMIILQTRTMWLWENTMWKCLKTLCMMMTYLCC